MKNARRATDMIRMRVRENKRFEHASAAHDVGNDRRPSRVACLPNPARVEKQPVPLVSAEKNRVALPHVENVKLDAAGIREVDRGRPGDN